MNRPLDPRDLRAQERQTAGLESRQKMIRDQQVEDIRWLMQQPQGRRIMARLLEMSGTERNSFTGSSTTFYNEGRRSVGVELSDEVKAVAFDNFIVMLQEQHK